MGTSDAERLGLACRFEGIEAVKALLKHGAKFDEPDGDHAVSLLNVSKQLLHGAYHLNRIELRNEFTNSDGKKHTLVQTSERIEIYRLLKNNAQKCRFHSDRLFYYAILANDTEMIAAMRENGETLPNDLVNILIKGGRNAEWSEFCYTFEGMGAEEFFAVIENLSHELNGKISFSEIFFCCAAPIIYTPEGLDFILQRFDQRKMNKGWLMKRFINGSEFSLLEVAAKHGWLTQPRKRDEMIQYASDNGKTEALAWLLEFKNRTADLAKERELSEKKMLRELNANPNSVTELKKAWNFVKNDDGTIILTNYKGKLAVVQVPQRIGKDIVTEIGHAALSGTTAVTKRRVRQEQVLLRQQTITRVILPEGIEAIGSYAFAHCGELTEINIPRSVSVIGERAFLACFKLKTLTIPETVTTIGAHIISGATNTIFIVTKGSAAEEYCKNNKIKFKYKANGATVSKKKQNEQK